MEKQPSLGEEEVKKSFERLEQIYTEKVLALLKQYPFEVCHKMFPKQKIYKMLEK